MSDFDFEAFISGARLAEDTFSLYLVDNGRKIAALQSELDKAKATAGDEREATAGVDTTGVEAQIAALVEEMSKSRREFTLRALTPDEWKKSAEPDLDAYDQLAMQSVEPPLTAEQWKRVGAAAGARQFGNFMASANALAVNDVVMPDFSPSNSTTPDLRESSSS